MTLLDFLDEAGIERCKEGHPHFRSGWANVDCPNCSKGWRHFRLGINVQHLYANCWACGSVYFATALAQLSGTSARSVIEKLDKIPFRPRETVKTSGKYKPPEGVKTGLLLYKPQRDYLEGRGFDCKTLQKLWKISGIAFASRLAWTIFIPIMFQGRAVSWTTRKIVDEGKRYHSASPDEEELSHKSLLYGEDYCRNSCVVVEGCTDAWRIGPGAVATFGINWTREQLLRIAAYPVRAVCYDNEPIARRQARKMVDELSVLPGKTSLIFLDSKDPGEAAKKEIKLIRKTFLEG